MITSLCRPHLRSKTIPEPHLMPIVILHEHLPLLPPPISSHKRRCFFTPHFHLWQPHPPPSMSVRRLSLLPLHLHDQSPNPATPISPPPSLRQAGSTTKCLVESLPLHRAEPQPNLSTPIARRSSPPWFVASLPHFASCPSSSTMPPHVREHPCADLHYHRHLIRSTATNNLHTSSHLPCCAALPHAFPSSDRLHHQDRRPCLLPLGRLLPPHGLWLCRAAHEPRCPYRAPMPPACCSATPGATFLWISHREDCFLHEHESSMLLRVAHFSM